MTIFTNDDPELDALLRAGDPVDQDTLLSVATSPAAAALHNAITRPTARASSRRRFLRPVVLAAAATVATTVTLSVTLLRPTASESAYGAALVRFAENSPRLLVGANSWHVTRADEENASTGEMTFAAGTQWLDVVWVDGATSKDSDKFDLTPVGSAEIDGANAYVGYYGPSGGGTSEDKEFEAIWSVGDQALDARGVFATRADFLAVATTLYRVDVDTWLSALPASVVDPSSRAAVIEEMLADVPQPAGFDVDKLATSSQVSDRYQLGAKVIGAVSCGWMHQWAHGDPAERQEAGAAMATSHDWSILKEMQADGDYPDVVWEIADAMNGAPLRITPGETLETWSQPALGC
jgi:hypothetical protein